MSTSAVSSALLGVSSSSSTTSTDTSSTSDEFLTLFIAELKNQDPTNAVDTSELTSQLATFTQVEQSVQTNLYLDTLSQYACLREQRSRRIVHREKRQPWIQAMSPCRMGMPTGKIVFRSVRGMPQIRQSPSSDSSGNTVINTIKKSESVVEVINSVSWDGKNSSRQDGR